MQSESELFAENLKLVEIHAWQLCRVRPDLSFEDLRQEGSIGLLEAIERFDPERGVLFRTFASKHIRGRMLDALRRACHYRSRAIDGGPPPVREVELEEAGRLAVGPDCTDYLLLTKLKLALEKLSFRHSHVVRMFFFEERTLREIGQGLAVSESRVSQILNDAVARLRKELACPTPATGTRPDEEDLPVAA